jgi:prepilin-type processing-associated H-X9-DG protein
MSEYAAGNLDNTGLVPQGTTGRTRAEVVDGLSHTLLAGDKAINLHAIHGPQGNEDQGYTASWDEDTLCLTRVPPVPDTTNPTVREYDRFGSSHPGGLNVALADGSVRYVSYAIAPGTFAALGTVAGGEPAPDF